MPNSNCPTPCEDIVGVDAPEPEAIASSYPTSAWEWSLKDSPMSLVML